MKIPIKTNSNNRLPKKTSQRQRSSPAKVKPSQILPGKIWEDKETPDTKIQIPKKAPKENLRFPTGQVELWGKITKASIYLLVFLLPLFFLPWTFNILDFNKQALMGILVFVALFAWILKILVSGRFEFNLSWLSLPIVILLVVYGISTLFSLWPYGSFWGWPLNVSAGFLTLLCFGILYFLIANVFTKKQEVFRLLLVLVISGFLAAIFGGLQLFGKFILPWDFAKIISFNTIGTVNSLAVFLAILLPLTIILQFYAKRWMRVMLAIFALVMLVSLVLVNFWAAWLVLIAGAAILFIFQMLNIKDSRAGGIQLSIALLIIALFFVIFRISLPGLPQTPFEVSPSQRAELSIAKSSLSESPILGTGPGTFIYNFTKFKSKDLNQTVFWNVRFGSGASEILDKLITTGILGILSLFAIFGMFFWLGFRYLKEKASDIKDGIPFLLGLGVFSAFGGVALSQFLYPANFSLTLVFWILLAGFTALDKRKIKSWEISPGSRLAVGVSFCLVLVLIFGIGLFFVGTQKYMAEIRYLQGLRNGQEGQTEQAILRLEEAINLNPSLDIYWRDISQFYLVRLNEVLGQRGLSSEEMTSQNQILVTGAVNSAKQAAELNPENVANWNVRGFTYRNMMGIVGGAGDWALNSYQKAGELEPTNPYIFTEIGRIYISKFDLGEGQKEENLRLALENFERSLSLKDDYAPAHFQIAMIYVREGKAKEAAVKLEAIKEVAPFDTGLAFQLGVIYYNDNQFEKAEGEFERAVGLDRNYSNARYFLGLIYDREGNKRDAISQFEKIEELNPENLEVKKILANLRDGKPALEGIQPGQPPIEEVPPERLEK
ncbi:MAG: tetratricopeptide repeat protein [Candidatus Nealsonbacteria bacterium]